MLLIGHGKPLAPKAARQDNRPQSGDDNHYDYQVDTNEMNESSKAVPKKNEHST